MSKEQARDNKGRHLYIFQITSKNVLYRTVVRRKKKVKRWVTVLKNLIEKNGYIGDYQEASLRIYEQWEQKRENP